jgi:hypothetical protein
MRTLEQQINWLASEITARNIHHEIQSNKFNIPLDLFKEEPKDDFLIFILESLYILLERDTTCDTCVNNYFDKITTEK